jgi:hypothetical protein
MVCGCAWRRQDRFTLAGAWKLPNRQEMMNMACVALSVCRLLSGCGLLSAAPRQTAKPCHAMSSQSHSVPAPAPASQASPRRRYLHLRMMTTYLPWLLCSLRLCAPGECRKPVKACQRLHRAALPPSDRGSQSFPTTSERAPVLCLRLHCTSPWFNCLFLLPTACVSTNNHLPRRAPIPIQTVPLPISLARNIEGSLSLSHSDQCTSHQSRLQISETHCGPPESPRAKKKERNGRLAAEAS